MSNKKAFALRLDAELLDAIEKWAADEFRSTNGQIEWIIYQALHKAGRLKKAKMDNADENSKEQNPTENDSTTDISPDDDRMDT